MQSWTFLTEKIFSFSCGLAKIFLILRKLSSHSSHVLINTYDGVVQLLHIVFTQAIDRNDFWFLLGDHLTGPSI